MATYNKQKLAEQADGIGFIRDTFEKVFRLTEILRFMLLMILTYYNIDTIRACLRFDPGSFRA